MSANTMVISGAGGGKGGGGGGGAVEAPDSLRSKQYARVLDLISEGEIEGLVDGLKSIYLDGTPLQNADDSFNFQDVVVDSRTGTQTQPYIPGFDAVESVVDVGVEVLQNISVTRTIMDQNVDAISVTITVPQLSTQDTTNGNLNGGSVAIAIDVQTNGGGFSQVVSDTITGKTMSSYQRSYRINLPGDGPWDVRVRRITADSTATVVNKTFWTDYTTIFDQKLRYPNSALVGISIDAAQFNSIPTRGYDVKLLKVLVPSNYFPLTRTYTRSAITGEDTGVAQAWDGTFYVAWSDNPAWCWYDLVTNERYGLGNFIDVAMVDKWAIYSIAKYCDELVPDGFGGMEPRFTCNVYLQTREEAYRVINSLASIFRGMSFWAGGGMTATCDKPTDAIALFTAANVVEGTFNYSGSDLKARHTVALVTWNDPANGYMQAVEYVEDHDGIRRYGVVETEVAAVGCASRGQAHRVGRAILLTELLETEIVTFKTGLEGTKVYPGAVIKTQDGSRAGKRLGGRIKAATADAITVDAPVTIEAGKAYTLSVVLPDGTVEERAINNAAGEAVTLIPATAFSAAPQTMAIWVLEVSDLALEQWRVIGMKESGKAQVEVIAVTYNPGKHDLIEYGIALEPVPTTAISTQSLPPMNLTAVTYVNAQRGLDVVVSWDAREGTRAATIMWRKDEDNFESAIIYENTFTIRNASLGSYSIRVSTVNVAGSPSPAAALTYNVVSATLLPDVTGLALKQPFVDQFASFVWDAPSSADSYDVEVVVGGAVKRAVTVPANWFNYHYADSMADGGGTPFRAFDLRVKARYGALQSGNWATVSVSNDAPPVPAANVVAIPAGFQVSAPLPSGSDYGGMIVWADTATGFVPGAANEKYDGVNNSTNVVGLTSGIPYYVRVAFYDVFGKIGLNISSEYVVTPTANDADLPVVTALPATATEGKTVYLTTDDKLYRYDGAAWQTWVDGSDILAASITAGKLSVTDLNAIAGNIGSLSAGGLTIGAQGYLRGGSTGYLTGTGFWMGYHTDAYKFHIGDPSGRYMTWTGTDLVIQGSQFTLVNGVATFSGSLDVKSATSGARLEIKNDVIKVYDAAGVLRVKLGNLSA